MASLSTLTYKSEIGKNGDDEPCRKKRRLHYHQSHSPISEAIAKTLVRPPRIDTWQHILRQLETFSSTNSSTLDDEHDGWIHSLYRTLLLHVGCTLSLSPNHDDNSHRQLLNVLCQCWKQVLDLMKTPSSNENEDAIELLEQILEKHGEHQSIAITCLDVVHHYLVKQRGGNICGKVLLIAILRLTVMKECISVTTKAMSVLKGASTNGKSAQILYAAAIVIQTCNEGTSQDQDGHSSPRDVKDELFSNDYYVIGREIITGGDTGMIMTRLTALPQEDMLLYLNGLSLSSRAAKSLVQWESILEMLYSISLKCDLGLSKDAARCLASIARNGGCSKRFLDKILELLSESSTVVKVVIISGIYEMLQKNSCTLSKEQTCSVLSVFCEMVRSELNDEKQPDWVIDGARLVSLITKTHLPKYGDRIDLELEMCMQCFSLLLSRASQDTVVHISLDCLLELSLKESLVRLMARQDNFLTSIASVATNEFITTNIKFKVIQILWNLAQEKSNLLILARTKPVLEALIAVASTNVEATTVTNARRYALETLLFLSELVSNRRILAKQVGLLACLIRYTRSMTASDTLLLLPKEKLKDRILAIAVLL